MDNREIILQSALDLFCARGYDAVGVQEIVDRAGVTKPTLYYYFGSKQGLMEEILHSNSAILEEMLKEAAETEGQVADILYQVARAYFDFAGTHRKFYLLMMSQLYAGRETEGFQVVFPLIRKYYQLVVKIFEDSAHILGNMRGRQEQFAVSFMGILDSHMMMLGRDIREEESINMSNEKTYEIVHQFLYGIFS
ncbi:MAG: TetR/AcrR family transcriptional regulator [Clostridia bacterium]|nr:TetR/AcrR family transcriptional regulator [Clostridia bacterium]NCC42076.1 TetR/AcrR family transcriptional regulator [Clostridia bacterium]